MKGGKGGSVAVQLTTADGEHVAFVSVVNFSPSAEAIEWKGRYFFHVTQNHYSEGTCLTPLHELDEDGQKIPEPPTVSEVKNA